MSPEQIRMYALEVVLKSTGPDGTDANSLVRDARVVEQYILSAKSGLVT